MLKTLSLQMVVAMLVTLSISSNAQTKDESAIKRHTLASAARITDIKGNMVTIVNDQGKTKTLEMSSVEGLVRGARVGWCEDDCRTLQIGDHTVQVRRAVETKR